MYDILIQNGHQIDGTGSPAMQAWVAVKDGKIVKLARHIDGDAKTVIDAKGKVITPGFIDSHSRVMICTDSGVTTPKTTMYHPRLRGSFPRALGRYVREKGVVSLPEMIRKMTAMPCAVYGFKTKGLVWEGFDADICIFDPETILDRADFTNPQLRAEGLDCVIVGGKIAAVNAVATGEKGGRMLYRYV